MVCSHLPLHPGAASPSGLMWNYEEVMRVVHRHGCVAACLAGHDHRGGYGVDAAASTTAPWRRRWSARPAPTPSAASTCTPTA